MIRRVANPTLVAAIFGGLAALAATAHAQQFSADIIRTTADGQPSAAPGKIYVSDSKVRVEIPEASDGFFVVDTGVPVSYFVRPTQRVFMDSKQSSRLTQILVPLDVTDPCRQWQSMANAAETDGHTDTWRCERIGHGIFEGRDTLIYRATLSENRRIVGRVDPRLNWPVSLEMDDGTIVNLRNIRERPQPAGLFEIPPDYRKFDPRALIEHIKQSDVWVEPQP